MIISAICWCTSWALSAPVSSPSIGVALGSISGEMGISRLRKWNSQGTWDFTGTFYLKGGGIHLVQHSFWGWSGPSRRFRAKPFLRVWGAPDLPEECGAEKSHSLFRTRQLSSKTRSSLYYALKLFETKN